MLDFSTFLDLPLIFYGIIALAIFMYVLLDGFDLGIGILFPFAPSDNCRDKMMNSVAPFWDGNETWLVLGGGLMMAAFPLAFSTIMPAFYLQIILMLLGLIFRGVAFEFRFKATSKNEQRIWDFSFCFGSIIATFFQGLMLGAFVSGDVFSGSYFSIFSIITAVALIFGYALIGAAWLIMKTHEKTQIWARKISFFLLIAVGFFILAVGLWTTFSRQEFYVRWFLQSDFELLMMIPAATFITFIFFFLALKKEREKMPFFLTILIFALCYLSLGISLFPYVAPYQMTFMQAAASNESLSLILVGVVITLPMILAYTAYSYHVFRGKSESARLY